MGSDIHALVECKVNGKWLMVDRCKGMATIRNYARFAALAGPNPKGLPEDLSDSGMLYAEEWSDDAHSHSFLDLEEASRLFLVTDRAPDKWWKQNPCEYYFNVADAKSNYHRLVFWFDC
jgi:hypothetical protein